MICEFIVANFDGLVRSAKASFSAIPANPGSGPGQAPESRKNKQFWTPAFAGVTVLMTFYEAINFAYRITAG